jgi:geranylgeranyl diphosphate synthase type II
VSVYGLDRARELARESHGKARAALSEAEGDTAHLGQIADYILTRTT